MKRQNVRTLSLVVCTFTYLLIGAAVFDALESETERRRWDFLKDVRDKMINKYNITEEDYRMIEIVIIENKPHKAGPQWKFAGAFYFATVVLAMIGYGHSTPVTIGGKAFCMAYAMVGIPLGLVMFQSIGERLNKVASVVIKRAKRHLRCCASQPPEATEMNLMLATGLLSTVIITTGAAVFSRYEGWSYFDSFYYCFVTLTTIGFGDYVALQNDQALTKKPGYVALSLVFILFGLAVVAASINLLVLRFMTMNAEDGLREDNELQAASRHVLSLESGEYVGVNGKLLAGHPRALADAGVVDQDSVCSCTCLGNSSVAGNNNTSNNHNNRREYYNNHQLHHRNSFSYPTSDVIAPRYASPLRVADDLGKAPRYSDLNPPADASDLLLLESACDIGGAGGLGGGVEGAPPPPGDCGDFLIEPPEVFTYAFRRKRVSI